MKKTIFFIIILFSFFQLTVFSLAIDKGEENPKITLSQKESSKPAGRPGGRRILPRLIERIIRPKIKTPREKKTPEQIETIEAVVPEVSLSKCFHISEAPIEFVRRASRHIERVRGTGGAPGWETAELGETVCPIYRLDIEGIAYYEFEIKPSGYIIFSAGEHDFPIPQWSPSGKPVSRKLKDLASSRGKKIEKLYKLDVLAYAAEDGDGEIIAGIGTLPLKIAGVNPNLVGSEECPLSEATALPVKGEKAYKVKIEGQSKLALQFQEWVSWKELKKNFPLNPYYKAVNNHLRRQAIEKWKSRREIESQPGLMLPGEFLGKEEETGSPEIRAFHLDQEPVTTYYWAGPDNRFDPAENRILAAEEAAEQDQRNYAQYNITRSYDGKCAKTGCGPTAWAMLYGYCDHQAARGDNPFWKPKYWGIYRQDGGRSEIDGDAPKNMTQGIKNMIRELGKDYLETVAIGYAGDDCLSGMTYPRKMQEGFRYLNNRASGPIVGKLYWTTPGSDRKKYRKIAMKRIKYDKMPAMLGQGYHYNMVFGYSQTKEGDSTSYEFYVNDGHGGDRAWVSASCWLVGYFLPSNGAFTKNDGLAVGDTDGDNKAEVVIAGDGSGVVDIFNAQGDKISSFDGNFTEGDALAVGNVLGTVTGDKIISYLSSFTKNNGMAIGDVNGDGKEEIVIAEDTTGRVELFDEDRCIGVDRGGRNVFYFDGDFTKNDGFAVGDVTGDGKDEIIVAGDGSGMVDIFSFNWSAPTRTEKIFSFDGNFTKNDGFAAGDINGDGKDEIVIAGDVSGRVDIFQYEKKDERDAAEEILIAGDGTGIVDIFNHSGEKLRSIDVDYSKNDGFAVGDINGDGWDEIFVAGDVSGVVDIFNRDGRKIVSFNGDFSKNDGFAIGDVLGGGKPEILIAGDVSGRVDVFSPTGAKIMSFNGDFSKNDGFAAGDINGNGKAEILIAGDVSGIVDIFTIRLDGNNNYITTKADSYDLYFTENDGFALGDVNGDGSNEILIGGDGTGVVDIFNAQGEKIGMI